MTKLKKPIYKDDRRIDLTAYMGPRRAGKHFYENEYGTYPLDPEEGYPSFFTDDVFTLYKEAGMNILLPEADAYYGTNITENGYAEEPDFEKSDLYEYMKMAKKHGLLVYPTTDELFSHIAHEDGPFGEKEKALLKDFVATIQAHFPGTFAGVLLTDEPPYSALDRIKKIMDYLHSDEMREIKSDLGMFTSMHPIYAPMDLLHKDYGDEKYARLRYDKHRMIAYQSYMEKTAEAVGEINFDHYALIYENQLTPGFYLNLEMAAEHGKKVGCPLATTLQSVQIDLVNNQQTNRASLIYRTPHYEDMRWQVYSALAFGVKRIGYYTFWTHYSLGPELKERRAMVIFDPSEDKGYRTTEIYDAVKAVNQEILSFDHVFLRFEWQGCRLVRVSRDRNIHNVKGGYEGGILKDVAATRDLVVGCMKNPEDNTEGYWIVNAENPFHDQINDVEVDFEGATRAIYYRKGKEYDTALTDGKFKIRLGVGEGIFVIPYKES